MKENSLLRHDVLFRAILVCFLTLLAVALSPVRARTSTGGVGYSFERYLNIRSAYSPSLSPDGKRLVYLSNTTGTAQLWSVQVGGGWPEQLTFYDDNVGGVAMSPTGSGIIFSKARGGDENYQLFWMSPDGATIRTLTDAPKVRHNFGQWSHDGSKISFSSNKRNPDYFDVYVMDVATGRVEMVYQQDGANFPSAWSFDNRRIIVTRTNETLSEDQDLYLVDLPSKTGTHLTPHQEAAAFGHINFSRDGRSLLLSTNQSRDWESLARLKLDNRRLEIVDETPWDVDASKLSVDGRLFAYTLNREGMSELFVRRVAPDGTLDKKPTPIPLPGKGVAGSLRFTRDNSKLVFGFDGASRTTDIWMFDLRNKRLSQLTRSSNAGIPQTSFVEPELIHYPTFDGRMIPAWYYRPQAARSTPGHQKLPTIVQVHGGPASQDRARFSNIRQYFLSRGYAVLAPNVRGSSGYGKNYQQLDDVRRREDSVKDLASAAQWLKTKGGADPKRIAVMGTSYGGYMTMAAITLYPDLWAAAISTVGIVNFESFLKNTAGYRRRLREAEYGSLENDLEFLRSVSPLHKVDRIKTPLMVIAGKNDPRVPYTEAEQVVKALRDRNGIVEYLLYADEGHGVSKLANRLDAYPKMAAFLERYMGTPRP